VPDILDEVKWGMDWLGRMQNGEGSAPSLVGGGGAESFRLPGEPVDACARYPFAKAFGQGKAQIRPPLLQLQDTPALHDGGQSAANCLDFR